MEKRPLRLLTPIVFLAAFGLAAPPLLRKAQDLYQHTRYQEALETLAAVGEVSGLARAIAGKCYYQLEDYKSASESLEKAVQSDPGNSEYHNWLGKAYGRRAENSSFFTAPRLATKARDSFQRAVELAPANLEAVADLFEYYLEAPGFLGGGAHKAAPLAESIRQTDPAEYHYFQARLAEKRKDFHAAERHYRTAAALPPSQVGRLLDLAGFLARQGRHQESDATFSEAEKLAPGNPKVLFARASAYVRAKRNLEAARQLLDRYLQSQLNPDLPPRKEAEQLRKKAQSG